MIRCDSIYPPSFPYSPSLQPSLLPSFPSSLSTIQPPSLPPSPPSTLHLFVSQVHFTSLSFHTLTPLTLLSLPWFLPFFLLAYFLSLLQWSLPSSHHLLIILSSLSFLYSSSPPYQHLIFNIIAILSFLWSINSSSSSFYFSCPSSFSSSSNSSSFSSHPISAPSLVPVPA